MTSGGRHSVSVAAVVTDDQERVLVVQRRDNGRWEIPGGVLELDESVHAGLRREVEEETGLLVDPVRLTGVYKNVRLGVVALVFRARLVSGRARPTEESVQVAWWDPGMIPAQMAEVFTIRVVDALDRGLDIVGPAVRVHDGVHLLR